jgi:hypothetical protein
MRKASSDAFISCLPPSDQTDTISLRTLDARTSIKLHRILERGLQVLYVEEALQRPRGDFLLGFRLPIVAACAKQTLGYTFISLWSLLSDLIFSNFPLVSQTLQQQLTKA